MCCRAVCIIKFRIWKQQNPKTAPERISGSAEKSVFPCAHICVYAHRHIKKAAVKFRSKKAYSKHSPQSIKLSACVQYCHVAHLLCTHALIAALKCKIRVQQTTERYRPLRACSYPFSQRILPQAKINMTASPFIQFVFGSAEPAFRRSSREDAFLRTAGNPFRSCF